MRLDELASNYYPGDEDPTIGEDTYNIVIPEWEIYSDDGTDLLGKGRLYTEVTGAHGVSRQNKRKPVFDITEVKVLKLVIFGKTYTKADAEREFGVENFDEGMLKDSAGFELEKQGVHIRLFNE
jgi:hypothetical protein